jgi:hypothetical protein
MIRPIEFWLDFICGAFVALGVFLMIKCLKSLIMGEYSDAKTYFWTGLTALLTGCLSIYICNIMIK